MNNNNNKPKKAAPKSSSKGKQRASASSTKARKSKSKSTAGTSNASADGNRRGGASITCERGRIRIKHRELVAVVSSLDGQLTYQKFLLNPGNRYLFPWLSKISVAYENYRFKDLNLVYRTRVPTTVPGTMLFCVDPDPTDEAPATFFEFAGFQSMKEAPVWQNLSTHITSREMNNIGPDKFIDHSLSETVPDATKHSGRVYVAAETSGGFAPSVALPIGHLWIEYDVELYNPSSEETREPAVNGLVTGSATNFVITSPPPPGMFVESEWAINTGLYQGIKFNKPGVFHVTWNPIVTGGGTVANPWMNWIQIGGLAGTNPAPLVDFTLGGAALAGNYCAFVVEVVQTNEVLNFYGTFSGTITQVDSVITAARLGPSQFHAW